VPVSLLAWAWNRQGWPAVERLAGGTWDVVHSASPLLIPSTAAAGVITIHDLDFLRHPDRVTAEMRRDFPSLVRVHATRADAIVVSSRHAAADVVQTLGVDPSRVHVCPAGAPAWAAAIARGRAERSRRHFLFLGTLEPRKNVGVLLDAYARLVSADPSTPPLVIAGRHTPTAAAWTARVATAPLAGRVTLMGYVDDEHRHALLADAHAVVMPSLDEGFGLPVLEAMACGVPVVVSNAGALPELVGDAARPVDPMDVEGVATLMRDLLDSERAASAAARGLARAARYSWAACARAVHAAYTAACEVHAHRR
jgi:glycosyltransferase involved in cell wall biosynthesis